MNRYYSRWVGYIQKYHHWPITLRRGASFWPTPKLSIWWAMGLFENRLRRLRLNLMMSHHSFPMKMLCFSWGSPILKVSASLKSMEIHQSSVNPSVNHLFSNRPQRQLETIDGYAGLATRLTSWTNQLVRSVATRVGIRDGLRHGFWHRHGLY